MASSRPPDVEYGHVYFASGGFLCQNYGTGLFAFNFDGQGVIEFDVIQVIGFFCSEQSLQFLPVEIIAAVGRDRQIADPQGCDVLEEMRTLGWIGFEIIAGGLNDRADPGDVLPIDRDAKPTVG